MPQLIGEGNDWSLGGGLKIPAEPLGVRRRWRRLMVVVIVLVLRFRVGSPFGGVVAVVDGVDDVEEVEEVAGDWYAEGLSGEVRIRVRVRVRWVRVGSQRVGWWLACNLWVAAADEIDLGH